MISHERLAVASWFLRKSLPPQPTRAIFSPEQSLSTGLDHQLDRSTPVCPLKGLLLFLREWHWLQSPARKRTHVISRAHGCRSGLADRRRANRNPEPILSISALRNPEHVGPVRQGQDGRTPAFQPRSQPFFAIRTNALDIVSRPALRCPQFGPADDLHGEA